MILASIMTCGVRVSSCLTRFLTPCDIFGDIFHNERIGPVIHPDIAPLAQHALDLVQDLLGCGIVDGDELCR